MENVIKLSDVFQLNSNEKFRMASIVELQKYIRFQLSQLKTENKHHEFETLCRYFVKARICSNIIPATGPVGSGGDQGRDAESFRTYIQASPIANSTFIGLASEKTMVMCCSLKEEIEGKIKEDVITVTSSGTTVDDVYFFCEANLPVAKRHKLQDWAKIEHHVHLEIMDGQGLSELLADLEIFWIAEQFLAVPLEMCPRARNEENTYGDYRKIWLVEKRTPSNIADFIQIKYAMREAIFEANARPDLSSWIKVMELFLEKEIPTHLRRKAIYEICVAALRGQNRLSERKDLIDEYFAEIAEINDLAELKNVATLLSYCSSATMLGAYVEDAKVLYERTTTLKNHLDDLLNHIPNSGTKCRLLDIRGFVAAFVYRDGPEPKMPEFSDSITYWNLLLDEVPKAPLYPLEELSDLLVKMTEVINVDTKYKALMRRTDDLLAERSGDFLPAEKCRDRAVILLDRGDYLGAIRELHTAKVKWFSAETLRGSLLSIMILAECYQQMGLLYAAKYYCAAAAYLSWHADDDRFRSYLSRTLVRMAAYAFQNGEWFAFAIIMDAGLIAHNSFDLDPWEFTEHKELPGVLSNSLVALTILKRFAPNAHSELERLINKWQVPPDLKEAFDDMLVNDGYWKTASDADVLAKLSKDSYGQPCSDLGQTRTVTWRALGITWTVSFKNDFKTILISEEIISTIQIITADIAGNDLLLLPTSVRAEIEVTDEKDYEVENVSNNKEGIWKVRVPKEWIGDKNHKEDLRKNNDAFAIGLFADCSAIESGEFTEILESLFSEGLPSKTFVVGAYSDLYLHVVDQTEFKNLLRQNFTPLFAAKDFVHQEHPSLRWNDSIAQKYSKADAKEFLKNRYEKAIRPIRKSLPIWMNDSGFAEKINKLRARGFKDWMIVLIISTMAANYRANKLYGNFSLEVAMTKTRNLMAKEESEDDLNVPLGIFTDEAIEVQINMTYGAIANTWGLEVRNKCPDFQAWAELLNKRFRNNLDDISHDDMFKKDHAA